MKFGGDYLHFRMNYLQSSQARGTYTYTGAFTSADGSGIDSGDPFADLLLGSPAFAAPAPYTFGNAGRDIGSGPKNNIFDFVLFRQFRLKELGAVQVRAESFNAFNHPNWGIPVPNPDSGPFFGRIVAAGDPRRFQFALRYDF